MPSSVTIALLGIVIFLVVAMIGKRILALLQSAPVNVTESGPGLSQNPELRSLHRFRAADRVLLAWEDSDHRFGRAEGQLVEISEYSARVRSKVPLRLGTCLIQIPALRCTTACNVRRCDVAKSGFDLGLEFRGPLFPTIRT